MDLRIVEEPVTAENLAAYATVSIAFTVESRLRLDLVDKGLGGFSLTEEPVETPWVKDYDAAESPARWAVWWDLSNWTMFVAYDGDRRVGGAIMAWNTPGVNFLRRRVDTAALWDLRVDPLYRGRGIGKQLFERGVAWARAKGCQLKKIETQNINVRACRFYQARDCRLSSIDRHAYREFPDEVQLVWHLDL
jgi:GNAT superfamily N-acetyltransferase